MAEFQCGQWKGNPPKGTMTPRKRIGRIFDKNGDEWEVLYWNVDSKPAAAQLHIREDLSVGRKVFWPTREEATTWRDNPVSPSLEEIKAALAKCTWHKPSRGLIQVWMDIRRKK